MNNPPLHRRTISIAQRGQIVQRVIVDGWTSAQVAASFDVPKCIVDVWVADFRRNGMASLRDEPGETIAAELVHLILARPLRAILRRLSLGRRRFLADEPLFQPLPLRRSHKDGQR